MKIIVPLFLLAITGPVSAHPDLFERAELALEAREAALAAAKAKADGLCRDYVGKYQALLVDYFVQNGTEYEAMRKRVLKDARVTPEMFQQYFSKMLSTFEMLHRRIRNSKLYDGEFTASYFLRGATVWINNFNDLFHVTEMFYHHNRSPLSDVPTVDGEDTDLEFFAGGMAYIAYRYDQHHNQRRARHEWDDFNNTAAVELRLTNNSETGEVVPDRLSKDTFERLAQDGIIATPEKFSRFGLGFNNNRRFHYFRKVIQADLWAARAVQRNRPEEILLGLGDQSVRLFLRLFRVIEGRLHRFKPTADLLFLEELTPGVFAAHIRELKFYAPWSKVVDVNKALEQLRSTWEGMLDAYGKEIPILSLEIIVPQRKEWLRGSLGNGYHLGKADQTRRRGEMLNPLHHNNAPVLIDYNNRSIQVYVRQVPISDDRYKEIAADIPPEDDEQSGTTVQNGTGPTAPGSSPN